MAFVMWNWTLVDPADCIPPCASDSEGNASPLNDIDLTSDETGSDEPIMDEEVPTITHSVVFKCIGSHKEHRYQELLSLANKKVKDGPTVPVKLQPEPDNQFDCKAIAIMTAVKDKWARIGYIVKEALDDVHEAINNNKILSVSFAWLKYIVYFKCPGWYAGIKITRSGEWSDHVLRSRANTYM